MSWRRRQFFQYLGALLGGGWQASKRNASAAPARPDRQLPEIQREHHDLVVVGGGIAGVCTAISAARNGVRVALVHERAMLGGNSSSEVRLFPENATAHQVWIKECGLFEEIHIEERVRNHYAYREGTMNCHWDLVLYEWVIREANITLYLNTHMHRALMRDETTIDAVYCIQLGTEREFELAAPLFVDATGDGVLADRAGAEYRWGRESRSEFNEPSAPEVPDEQLMGSTLFFRAVDAGRPVPFKRPAWTVEMPSESEFEGRNHTYLEGGYWWIEVGSPYHPIRDNNAIIHEGLRHLLGVWDHIKNQGEHGAENYSLDFVAFWPYKRECRRIVGDYILTQNHLLNPQLLDDNVAYGVWFVDIHARGILDRTQPPFESPFADENWDHAGTRCYGIPLRALYSKNIENLMMAGRPISCSYAAFSSTRVLCTGAVVGQAVGAAASLCKKLQTVPRQIATHHARECQQIILKDDGYIPGVINEDPGDLARSARVSASSDATLVFPVREDEEEELRLPLAQIFPCSSNRISRVSLRLRSERADDATVTLGLRGAAHVWDFRQSRDIARAEAIVTPGPERWVHFNINARVQPDKLYYVYTDAQPGVFWKRFHEDDHDLLNRCPVAVAPASFPGKLYWRPIRDGRSFCMRLTPEARPFSPQNVVRGTNRPDTWTNLWASDPALGLPAWIQLTWSHPIPFNRVHITFDTNMNRRVRLPLFRYPECVRDYELECWRPSGWRTVCSIADNYERRRVHRFDTITASGLRLTVHKTNGVPNARIYEIRVYHDDQMENPTA